MPKMDITAKDNFMADITRPAKGKRLTALDGLRFGLGFAVGNLLVLALLGAAAWGIVKALHLG